MIETVTNRAGEACRIERRHGAPCVIRTPVHDEPPGMYRGITSLVVSFGLDYIRGNRRPYFSITADAWTAERSREAPYGGCLHDLILHELPELADMVALHLSDMDGTPMHAEANGWYWLAGACGGLGEKYHGSNGDFRKSADECLRILAEHLRIPLDGHPSDPAMRSATTLRGWALENERQGVTKHGKEGVWPDFIRSQRERWKREAEACIERYGLTVHGDKWEPAASE